MKWMLLWLIGSFIFALGYVSGALLARSAANEIEWARPSRRRRSHDGAMSATRPDGDRVGV